MSPLRKRRLGIATFIVVGSACTIGLAGYALQENLELFYLPDKVVAGDVPINKRVRAGGMVLEGSIQRSSTDLSIRFEISDLEGSSFPVVYTGLLPNLFQEGQGTIVTGTLDENGLFHADQVLAKHDENYVPPELADFHSSE